MNLFIVASLLFTTFATAGCDKKGYTPPELDATSADEVTTDTAPAWADYDVALTAWSGSATWTVYTTDGSPPVTCPVGSLVTGFQCRGSRCDDVRLKCQPQTGHTLNSRTWTSYFSEESTNYRRCTSFMSGLSCTGAYCDNMSMECTSSTRVPSSCVWSGYFSEEDPAFEAPTGTFIRALQCSGTSCDNVRAEYCRD